MNILKGHTGFDFGWLSLVNSILTENTVLRSFLAALEQLLYCYCIITLLYKIFF